MQIVKLGLADYMPSKNKHLCRYVIDWNFTASVGVVGVSVGQPHIKFECDMPN